MLKIWGRVNSVNVKKVLWCVDELGLPYERIDAGMELGVGEYAGIPQDEPQRPGADDGRQRLHRLGVALHRALPLRPVRQGRAPADGDGAAHHRQPVDGLVVLVPGQRARRLLEPDPHAGRQARHEGSRGSRIKSGQMAAILDAALADRLYLAGPFTMGEIPIGCEVQRWMRLPMERPKLPHLEAWFERLCARTAFKKNVDIPLS
jgi:glutathione S-transferase